MPTTPTTSYTVWIPVLAAIGGALIGILGVYLTQFLNWKFGMNRFLKEKDLTRRLDWHERAYRAIVEREILLDEVIDSIKSHRPNVGSMEQKGLINLISARILLKESEIFASNKSYLICKNLLCVIEENNNMVAADFVANRDYVNGEPPAKDILDIISDGYAKEKSYLEEAKVALADDIREGL